MCPDLLYLSQSLADIATKENIASWEGRREEVRFVMASRRRQIEEVMAETQDPVVRMQLTGLLNDELQRQNGIVRRAADALDAMLRDAFGRSGNRSTEKTGHDKTKTCRKPRKQLTRRSPKEVETDTHTLPDDLAEIVAAWPKLPDHVKAAMCDILRVT